MSAAARAAPSVATGRQAGGSSDGGDEPPAHSVPVEPVAHMEPVLDDLLPSAVVVARRYGRYGGTVLERPAPVGSSRQRRGLHLRSLNDEGLEKLHRSQPRA